MNDILRNLIISVDNGCTDYIIENTPAFILQEMFEQGCLDKEYHKNTYALQAVRSFQLMLGYFKND